MSNRKYAALLEGGTHSEKERMQSILENFIAPFVEKAVEQFLASPSNLGYSAQDIFGNIGQGKLIELAPDLAGKYQVTVGQLEDITSAPAWKLVIGYKEKSMWRLENMIATINGGAMEGLTASPVNISAGSIIASTIRGEHLSSASIDTLDGYHTHSFGALSALERTPTSYATYGITESIDGEIADTFISPHTANEISSRVLNGLGVPREVLGLNPDAAIDYIPPARYGVGIINNSGVARATQHPATLSTGGQDE